MLPLIALNRCCIDCLSGGNGGGAFSTGTYSDEWSSESAYINGDWVLASGTMTGSGNTYYKQSSRGDCESENYYEEVYNGVVQRTEFFWSTSHTESSHVITEAFSVSQTVSNGAWVDSGKSVVITETKHSANSGEADNIYLYPYASRRYNYEYSDSTDFSSTKEYDTIGLVSSEWSFKRQYQTDRKEYMNNALYEGEEKDYYEYVSSSGQWNGHYYFTYLDGTDFASITDISLNNGNISGEFRSYAYGALVYQSSIPSYYIPEYYFDGASDQSTRGDSTNLSSAPAPAAPPALQQKPTVPKVSNYEKPVTALSGQGITGDDFLDGILQNRRNCMNSKAKEMVGIADAAARAC